MLTCPLRLLSMSILPSSPFLSSLFHYSLCCFTSPYLLSSLWSSRDNNKLNFFNYRIDGLGDSKCSEIQDYLLEKTGQRSVPNIFIGMLLIYIFPESHKAYFFSISISDQKHIGGNYRNLTLFNPVWIITNLSPSPYQVRTNSLNCRVKESWKH